MLGGNCLLNSMQKKALIQISPVKIFVNFPNTFYLGCLSVCKFIPHIGSFLIYSCSLILSKKRGCFRHLFFILNRWERLIPPLRKRFKEFVSTKIWCKAFISSYAWLSNLSKWPASEIPILTPSPMA